MELETQGLLASIILQICTSNRTCTWRRQIIRYPIYGGMQDWNYIHGGCFELTLEISDTKWPKADELPIIWEHSRMSMLNLLASLIKAIERRGTPCHLQ
uniref:Peptidase M14 domain-containing protein n=1 Tax=Zea mays TaxID=4577 RepID=A0A804LTL6_MAIZE